MVCGLGLGASYDCGDQVEEDGKVLSETLYMIAEPEGSGANRVPPPQALNFDGKGLGENLVMTAKPEDSGAYIVPPP